MIHTKVAASASTAVDGRILDAAERLVARFGYSKTTIVDIAREAGIGKGSVYLHFPSKEAVALGIIDRMAGDAIAALTRIAGRTREPIRDRLRTMIVARVMLRFDRLHAFADALHDLLAALRPALLAQRHRHLSKERQVFADVVAGGVRARDLRSTDPKVAAQAILDATNSLLPYHLSRRQLGARATVERNANAIAELLVAGLSVA